MPRQPLGYVLDRLLGRCEKCGKIDDPVIVEVFKRGPKNYAYGLQTKRGLSHRLEPKMLCKSCAKEYLDNASTMIERGERAYILVHSYRDGRLIASKDVIGE
ncbi:hypothetical protein DRO54_04175 [Candidatus Bathyarchaeota archaeon]|nr:MAG: hypothetical protein DRO54_04175 [Candidatus Bathyarchaeota archaeon]